MKIKNIFNNLEISTKRPESFLDLTNYEELRRKIKCINLLSSPLTIEDLELVETDFSYENKEKLYEKLNNNVIAVEILNRKYLNKNTTKKTKNNFIKKYERQLSLRSELPKNLTSDDIKLMEKLLKVKKENEIKNKKTIEKLMSYDHDYGNIKEEDLIITDDNKKKLFSYTSADKVLKFYQNFVERGASIEKYKEEQKYLKQQAKRYSTINIVNEELNKYAKEYKNSQKNKISTTNIFNCTKTSTRCETDPVVNENNKLFFTETDSTKPKIRNISLLKGSVLPPTSRTTSNFYYPKNPSYSIYSQTQTNENNLSISDVHIDERAENLKIIEDKSKKLRKLEKNCELIAAVDYEKIIENTKNTDKFIRSSIVSKPISKFSKLTFKNLKYIDTHSKFRQGIDNEHRFFNKFSKFSDVKMFSRENTVFSKIDSNDSNRITKMKLSKKKAWDLHVDKHLKKEGIMHHRSRGPFLYGETQGYHMVNYDRIYGVEKDLKKLLNYD